MNFIIKSNKGFFGTPDYSQIKRIEAIHIGTRTPYTLKYPNGDQKKVEFKTFKMVPQQTIAQLEKDIEQVKMQQAHLEKDINISKPDYNDLKEFYENKLTQLYAEKAKIENYRPIN